MDRDRDLGAEGTKDKAKGKLNETVGEVEKGVGKATGDKKTEAGGLERKGKGKIQEGVGKAKKAADELLDE